MRRSMLLTLAAALFGSAVLAPTLFALFIGLEGAVTGSSFYEGWLARDGDAARALSANASLVAVLVLPLVPSALAALVASRLAQSGIARPLLASLLGWPLLLGLALPALPFGDGPPMVGDALAPYVVLALVVHAAVVAALVTLSLRGPSVRPPARSLEHPTAS